MLPNYEQYGSSIIIRNTSNKEPGYEPGCGISESADTLTDDDVAERIEADMYPDLSDRPPVYFWWW